MKKRSKAARLIVGIVAVFGSILASWFLTDILGDLSDFVVLPGVITFIYLNPELMAGE